FGGFFLARLVPASARKSCTHLLARHAPDKRCISHRPNPAGFRRNLFVVLVYLARIGVVRPGPPLPSTERDVGIAEEIFLENVQPGGCCRKNRTGCLASEWKDPADRCNSLCIIFRRRVCSRRWSAGSQF